MNAKTFCIAAIAIALGFCATAVLADQTDELLKLEKQFSALRSQGQYAAALTAAKRWDRQQPKWSSPYYWGTFVHIGPN